MDPAPHPPLKATQYLTLLLLAQEPTYGVALVERLEERSGGAIRLNAGSLYRMIAALVDDGLVEHVEEVPTPGGAGAPRKIYAVTARGRDVLRAEAELQEALRGIARSLKLVEDQR